MKKLLYFMLIINFILFFTSCTIDSVNKNSLGEDVMHCFEDKDIAGLEKLFCEEIQTTHFLDEEIQNAFDYLDGEIIDYNINNGSDGVSIDNGKITKKEFNVQIRNIRTTEQKEYLISFAYRSVDVNNPDKIGISKLSVGTYNGKYVEQKTKVYVGDNV